VMSDVLVDGFDQLGHGGVHASAPTLTTRVAVRRRADDAAFRRQGARRLEHEQELDLRHRHDTWTQSGSKVYNDRSDEESWVRLPDRRVMTYTFVSLFQLQ